MKISLNWIFDHIKGDVAGVNIAELVESFIKTTAEIEGYKKVTIDIGALILVQIISINQATVVVYSPEHTKEYIMPARPDVVQNAWFMVKICDGKPHWATTTSVGGTKEMILPAIYCVADMQAGSWKSSIEKEDYIIEVDNKSINSRPDLWGHRGLAREIAAIFNLPLRQWQEFIVDKAVSKIEEKGSQIAVAIKAPDACTRFAALYFPAIDCQASHLNMVVRLSRLDSRAINFLVDATNYIMLDLGQPMHVFDADLCTAKNITIEYAKPKEKLELLDGESIELTAQDLVIADGGKAISLAGVMGGAATAINSGTKSVLLESAHFDPVIIRRSSARHKKRTESSMRFEKNIDPCGNIDAIKRFLYLLDHAGIAYSAHEKIISLGMLPEHKIVVVHHTFIEARLGLLVKPARVVEILSKLEFAIEQSVENGTIIYHITIPSFRATKDIKIPEDIVEEIGRSMGYDTIPRVMPNLQLRPHDLHITYTTRAIKNFLSYGLQMKELYGYSFFDESMLRQLNWQPQRYVPIKNPISENYTRLVTTLQPHLLKAIAENSIAHAQLRFYELGRVWHMDGENIIEQKSLSGVFFNSTSSMKNIIDFYTGKAYLSHMFNKLYMDISWRALENNIFSWNSLHETAELIHEGQLIGIAGMIDQSLVDSLSPAGGSIFIFEIDADYVLNYRKPLKYFTPLSKYPSVRRDISVMILASVTTDELRTNIKKIDGRIADVTLIDFFTRPEWENQKALTFQIEIEDKEKTLTSDEVDAIVSEIAEQLKKQGAVIR